ncbi:MAG: hypothetical protein ACLU8F_07100 [Clostridia bacterium]
MGMIEALKKIFGPNEAAEEMDEIIKQDLQFVRNAEPSKGSWEAELEEKMNIFGEPAKKGTFKVDPKDLSKSKTSKAGRATRRKEDELER